MPSSLCASFLGLCLLALACETVRAENPSASEAVTALDALVVGDEADEKYDPTGMDGPEAEMNEPPFSNDLLGGAQREEEFATELNAELQLATGASPADLATGVNRVNLRGFPTPRLRNGFSQIGVPEVLNVERVELVQGPLTPVAGRGAPGGIQNFVTARPRGKNQTRFDFFISGRHDRQVRVENTLTLKPKKLWSRLAAGWQERDGPEAYAFSRSKYASGALIWRHSRAASTMVMLDYSEVDANSAPGVPEYRVSATDKQISGPYRPLAYFHTYGPNAGIEKRIASASVQFEGQLGKHFSLRANVQGWLRELQEERFTTGQYLLDTGKYGGKREPQHIEQPLRAFNAGVEATARAFAFKADHKLTLLVESNHANYSREQRALPTAVRDALPAEALTFDPSAPDFSRPEYSTEVYSRILTDRHEVTDYRSASLGLRSAFWRGRLVTSAGARVDFVDLNLRDDRPGAVRPRVADRVDEPTYHAGANYQWVPGRLLVFANTSTAFEPSTRVDARTGRIQGNETTLGYEAGLKGLFLKRRVSATVLLFRFNNRNISRRNPLYDDPIADAGQTQPQLVAAGEERFTGGTLDLKATPAAGWTISGRATVTQALTTASPDLPEEIGRPITRLPRTTVGATGRYQFSTGRLNRLWLSATVTHVSAYVAYYESVSRHALAYPENTLLGLNAGYSWKGGTVKKPAGHTLGFGVRNALDRDQLATLARPGQGRDVNLSYSVTF